MKALILAQMGLSQRIVPLRVVAVCATGLAERKCPSHA